MNKTPENLQLESWHRYFAIKTNNASWGMSETLEDVLSNTELLDMAHASAWHWRVVWRGRGFATRLCGLLAQNFLTQGQVQELIIVSEPDSIADRIYSKLGFKAVSYQIALITDPSPSQID